MSYFEDASLVYIPSAVKNAKTYSIKPTDGSGDLTFSRASNATRVNSSGLVEKVRENLLLQSNQFDTTWVNSNSSETGGQSGYDGTSDAWLLNKTDANGQLNQSVSSNGVNTFSVYAKAGTSNWLRLTPYDDSFFDLQNGIAYASGPTTIAANIVSVGGGWYRCSITYNATSTIVRIIVADSSSSSSGTSGNIYIQDAQLETGDIATDYIATTSAAVSVGPVSGLPRLDYSGGASCPSLLLEPQRTNSVIWSEQIDNAGWTKINAPTITTNIATAPDGYGGADGIQDTTGSNFKRIRQLISVSANSTNTASVFVKKETSQTNFGGLSMGYTGGSARYAYGIINPITGTIVVSTDSVISSSSTKVEDFGDWWRFSLTTTDNGGNTTIEIAYYSTLSNNGTTAGVGAGSVRTIWGLQLELGASYASSYIPTLSSAVTRVEDQSASNDLTSFGFGNSYTVLFDMNLEPAINNVVNFEFKTTTGTTSFTARNFSGNFRVYDNIGPVYPTGGVSSETNKWVMQVDGTNFALFGVSGGVAVKYPYGSLTPRNLGYLSIAASLSAVDINKFIIFPTALSDADCGTLIL